MVIYMGHEIDMSKYDVRTDLAIDLTDNSDTHYESGNVSVSKIYLDEDKGKIINKKKGMYTTIEFKDVTDYDNASQIKGVFFKELSSMLLYMGINDNDSCLVIGLGNKKSAPDSIGPMTLDKIIVTNHLFQYGEVEEGFRRVFGISPSVMGETGIETSDYVLGICKVIKPDFVIIVDALASSSIERVNKTIQMTDAGINPGSGIGNVRKEISYDSLRIPVLAIGVPTVVDAASIVSDTIRYMYKHFAYTRANFNNPANRLMVGPNYLNKDVYVDSNDKKNLFGLVGNLSDDDVKKFIYEILNPIGYNLMVTPKEEDFVAIKIAEILGDGINRALHKKLE